MATMSKKVTEGKAEHAKLTEYVSCTANICAKKFAVYFKPSKLMYDKKLLHVL